MDDDFERWRAAAVAMTTYPGECVLCYVDRMLSAFGCDGTLRWSVRWRNRRAPRAMDLESRLTARGAYCDCEIFSNGWERLRARGESGDPARPEARPPCLRAQVASEPCDDWVPLQRPGW